MVAGELKIEPEAIKRKLVFFIKNETKKRGFNRLIVGLSGGLDSCVVAYLAIEALGKENLFALILPYKATPKSSFKDAKKIIENLKINFEMIDITPMLEAYFKLSQGADRIRRGNKMARERMSILYDRSKELDALVIGTSNKTELLLGYGTIYGDIACALNPIGDLYKTQVRQLAEFMGIPKSIIKKVPSAELWPGQTDEGELGLSYEEVDRLLYYMVDRRLAEESLIKKGFKKDFVRRVKLLIKNSSFKRQLPKIAKLNL